MGKRTSWMRVSAMILELKDIRYTYPDGYIALDKVNATVPEKSFVVLLGESGAGKSTLFKVISGLADPDEGSVFINDQDVTNVKTASRDLTMIFQDFVLYPHLTVYHNVMVGLNGFVMSEEEKDLRVKEILTEFGLRNYLNFKPRHLSDGQKQRVCICKALIREPSLFLMDEPLSNLDLPQRERIKRELKNIFDKYHSSFFYITHDLKDAETLATLIWIIDRGRVVQQGTLQEIRDNPKNLKSMELVYGGNLNEYQVSYDGRCAKNDAFALPLEGKRTKKNYTLAFSYKGVCVDENGPIEGEALSLKMTSGGLLLNSKLKNGTLLGCVVDEDFEVDPGTLVRFSVKPGKAHLFQAKAN